jgi:mannose-6-phosphate isomerase-like protein (cupin superfamily)
MIMRPKIAKGNLTDEYFTQERCHILELSTLESDNKLSIARARVEPGVNTIRHILKGIDERYIITAGNGMVEIGDMLPSNVQAGDVVFVPAGIPQKIKNIGSTDLIFYCICTPPFRPDCYEVIVAKKRQSE